MRLSEIVQHCGAKLHAYSEDVSFLVIASDPAERVSEATMQFIGPVSVIQMFAGALTALQNRTGMRDSDIERFVQDVLRCQRGRKIVSAG